MKFFYYSAMEKVVHVLDSEIQPDEPWVGVLVGSFPSPSATPPPHPAFLVQAYLRNSDYPQTQGIEIIFQSPWNPT